MTNQLPSLLLPLVEPSQIVTPTVPLRVLYNYAPGHFGFSRAFQEVFTSRTGRRLTSGPYGKWMDARTDSVVINLVLEKGAVWSSGPDANLEVYEMDPLFKNTWSLREYCVPNNSEFESDGSCRVIEWIETGVEKLLVTALFQHLIHGVKLANLQSNVATILDGNSRTRRQTVGRI